MEAERSPGEAPETPRQQAQAGLAAAVARQAAVGAAKVTPPVLLAVLSAGALAPLATVPGTELALTGLTIAAGVGTNILSQVISDAIALLKRRVSAPEPREVERQLRERLTRMLEEDSDRAKRLRMEIAALLHELDAVGLSLELAINRGNQVLQEQLAAAFIELGSQFAEFRFLLTRLETAATEIQRILHRQDSEHRNDRNRMRAQSAQLTLLREEVAQLRKSRSGDSPPPRWDDGSPYRGLWPFEADHAAIFYGREQTTARLVSKVGERLAGPGIVIVTGASGAGKSSLVRAGLLPALARGLLPVAGADQWPCLLMAPTRAPLEELAAQLAAQSGKDAPALRSALADHPEEAHLLVRQILLAAGSRDDARLVIVVDQFEELFTSCQAADREAFITALVAAATTAQGPAGRPPALVIVVVRGDFVDRCAANQALAEALQDGQFVVGPMTRSELHRAITGPAAAADLTLDPGLTETILNDLGPRDRFGAGVLPLLSQTMLVTWENREGDRLTIRGYGRGGAVASVIQTSAESVYDSLSPSGQIIARRIFQRMTVVSADGPHARRRASRAELRAAGEHPEDVEPVLNAFAAKRLIVLHEQDAEIAHDYLLQSWPRLRAWLSEDQADHVLHSQLAEDALDWKRHGGDPSFLYQGSQLAAVQAAPWAEATEGPIVLDQVERDFLSAGIAASRRRDRRRRTVTATLAVLLVLALVLGGLSEYHRRQSEARQNVLLKQRDEELARALAAEAESERLTNRILAAQLSLTAWNLAQVPEARGALQNSVFAMEREPLAVPLGNAVERQGRVNGVLSADGRTPARHNNDDVEVWDVSTARRIVISPGMNIRDIWLADGGRTLVVGASYGEDWFARVFDTRTGKQRGATIGRIAPAPWYPLIVTGAERYLAVTVELDEGKMATQIFEAATMKPLGVIEDAWAHFMAVDPSGEKVALRKGVNGVEVRRLDGRGRPRSLKNCSAGYGESEGFFLDFSPDGKRLALMPDAREGCLWDVRTGKVIAGLPHPDFASGCGVRFSVDSLRLVTCDNSAAYVWSASDARLLVRYPLPVNAVRSVGASGRYLHWSLEGRIRTLDLAPWSPEMTLARPSAVAISPDASALGAIAGNRLTIWDVAERHVLLERSITPGDGALDRGRLAFSSDGSTVAFADEAGLTKLEIASGREVRLQESGDGVGKLHVSHDGVTVAAHVRDEVLVWRKWQTEPESRLDLPGSVVLMAPNGRQVLTHEYLGSSIEAYSIHPASAKRTAGAVGSPMLQAFSPDNATFAVSDEEDHNSVTLWSATTLAPIGLPFRTGSEKLYSTSFSADGSLLITASRPMGPGNSDVLIQIWDIATRRSIGEPIRIPTEGVYDVAADRDGHRIVVTTYEGDVYVYNLDPASLVRQVCAGLGRGFSEDEWDLYIGEKATYRPTCPR